MTRWLGSRTARKFLRHKPAVVSLVVVGIYLVVALVVAFGAVSLEDTMERVGPKSVPGFFAQQPPEKRLEDAEIVLEQMDRALERDDARAALAQIELGQLRVADRPLSELRAAVDRGLQLFDELVQSEDLNEDPRVLPRLEELEQVVGGLFAPLEGWDRVERWFEMVLGTDRQGRSIALRTVYSTKVALQVGLVTALISVLIGSLLGSAAAFFGGWVDHGVTWLYTTLSSIPNLVLLVLLAYMFTGTQFGETLIPLYVAFCLTFWVGTCRVIRGETLKIKQLEYVQAAVAMGFGRMRILGRHVLPNAAHLMLINFSLLFIGAIKSEVILSFLGLGVKQGPSWGIMISQSGPEVINGFFWQIGAATVAMFGLVLAFNILTDALQDVFDPRHL